jgi:hypothetical protein
MKAVVRLVALALLAGVLQTCGAVQPCNQIPQKSEGPCRVGLSPGWYYDDAWRTQ